jgi:hypothetical protein
MRRLQNKDTWLRWEMLLPGSESSSVLSEGVSKLVFGKYGIIGKNADFQFLFQKWVSHKEAQTLANHMIFKPSYTLKPATTVFLQFIQQRQGFAVNLETPSFRTHSI